LRIKNKCFIFAEYFGNEVEKNGVIAQLVVALPLHGRCRWFESSSPYKKKICTLKINVLSLQNISETKYKKNNLGMFTANNLHLIFTQNRNTHSDKLLNNWGGSSVGRAAD